MVQKRWMASSASKQREKCQIYEFFMINFITDLPPTRLHHKLSVPLNYLCLSFSVTSKAALGIVFWNVSPIDCHKINDKQTLKLFLGENVVRDRYVLRWTGCCSKSPDKLFVHFSCAFLRKQLCLSLLHRASSHIKSGKAFITYARWDARMNRWYWFCMFIENVRRTIVPSIYTVSQIIFGCCQWVVLQKIKKGNRMKILSRFLCSFFQRSMTR